MRPRRLVCIAGQKGPGGVGRLAAPTKCFANRQRQLERPQIALEADELEPRRPFGQPFGRRPRGEGVRARTEPHVEENQAIDLPALPCHQPLAEARLPDVELLGLDERTDARVHDLARGEAAHRQGAAAREDDLVARAVGTPAVVARALVGHARAPACSWWSISASRSCAKRA